MKKVLIIALGVLVILGAGFWLLRYGTSSVATKMISVSDIDDIKLNLASVSETPSGVLYRIMLVNGSEYIVKQNVVYLCYPVITGEKTTVNTVKIEATGNKLNIKPGEDRMLQVLVPTDYYMSTPELDKQHLNLEIKGYLEEVAAANYFHKMEYAEVPDEQSCLASKPVIYLYPIQQQQVAVQLDLDGQLTCTYPEYSNGWKVIARPDGSLINLADNRPYSYLYWEGDIPGARWDLSKGFVVAGRDIKEFLQATLAAMGLLPHEYNEFIVYWLPLLEKNQYNLITFAGKEYTDMARVQIVPKPDSILRVFMVYKPLDKPIKVQPQKLEPFKRQGFTVVEWGGTEVTP